MGLRRPAAAAPRRPGEPAARLRHARGDRHAGRQRLGAGDPRAASGRHDHRASAIEGRPIGIIANNPEHLGGAIDSDALRQGRALHAALRRASTFRSCRCATRRATWWGRRRRRPRWCAIAAAALSDRREPHRAGVHASCLRKALWPGRSGHDRRRDASSALFAVSWPTGEFGGMGLEGAVKLGYRKELAAIADPAERRAAYDQMVAELYEKGRAINQAVGYAVDDVIDPAETRRWVVAGLRSVPPPLPREGKKRPCVDGW